MKDLGDKALLLRILGAGLVLVLLLWTVLTPPAQAQAPGGARAVPPPTAEPELPASDLLLRYEAPVLSFRWSLAPEAALEPEFVRALRGDALAALGQERRAADEDAANPPPGRPPLQYQWLQRWKSEAETDGLLALSSSLYSFTGGAHGNLAFSSAIWDRGAGKRIGFAELFDNPAAAITALKPGFCKALDAERAKRRQGVKGSGFTECPDLARQQIVPVGEGRIGSFRVLVPPYEAGPWVEGAYEIGLDATPAKPFISPRFAGAFANN